jgi:hypothetical protein
MLLKSLALQQEELQRQNADECYAILEAWEAKVIPVIVPILHDVPRKRKVEDTKAFGFDYSNLPSRNSKRQSRWSEL